MDFFFSFLSLVSRWGIYLYIFYLSIYLFLSLFMYIRTHLHICICIFAYTFIYICIFAHTFISVYVCSHTPSSIYMYIRTHLHTCIGVDGLLFICPVQTVQRSSLSSPPLASHTNLCSSLLLLSSAVAPSLRMCPWTHTTSFSCAPPSPSAPLLVLSP